jgi:hypothetical protein
MKTVVPYLVPPEVLSCLIKILVAVSSLNMLSMLMALDLKTSSSNFLEAILHFNFS